MDGQTAIWSHPQQRYRTPKQKEDGKKGRIVNNKSLWKDNMTKILARRNAVWSWRYCYAIFASQLLSNYGPRGIYVYINSFNLI